MDSSYVDLVSVQHQQDLPYPPFAAREPDQDATRQCQQGHRGTVLSYFRCDRATLFLKHMTFFEVEKYHSMTTADAVMFRWQDEADAVDVPCENTVGDFIP